MWDLNEVKFVEVGKSGIGFRLSQRSVSSVKKFDLRKIVFDDDVVMSSRTPFMTFTSEGDQSFQVIKLRLVRPVVLEELKHAGRPTHTQIALRLIVQIAKPNFFPNFFTHFSLKNHSKVDYFSLFAKNFACHLK